MTSLVNSGAHPCEACGSTRLRQGPASHTTRRRIGWCRDCGARFLTTPATSPLAEQAAPEPRDSVDELSGWVGIKRERVGVEAWREALGWITSSLGDTGPHRLYDVGAGDGHFLRLARDEFGLEVTGNEVLASAVTLAQERHDVDLELGDLADFHHTEEFDAVTLWCVLAHVPDSNALMTQVRDMLKPGGVVFLQTPRWTVVDRAASAAQRVTRGRISTLPDRRVGPHHRVLHTAASIAAQLRRLGFVDPRAEPRSRYSLTSEAYLVSMDPPCWAVRPASWILDRAISSRFAPRIVLDVRARKDPRS